MNGFLKKLEDLSMAASFAQANDEKITLKILNKGLAIDHFSYTQDQTMANYEMKKENKNIDQEKRHYTWS